MEDGCINAKFIPTRSRTYTYLFSVCYKVAHVARKLSGPLDQPRHFYSDLLLAMSRHVQLANF